MYNDEYWKDIEGADGKYQVSNLGRVRKVKYLKPYNIDGYPIVCLDGRAKAVHRLVAETFLDNPEGKEFVNHKDGDRTNARQDNLEWVTPRENNLHWRWELAKDVFDVMREEDGMIFDSKTAVLEHYGTNPHVGQRVFYSKGDRTYFSGKKMREEILRAKKNKGKRPKNAVSIQYLPTGEVFPTIRDAAKALGFSNEYRMFRDLGEDSFLRLPKE